MILYKAQVSNPSGWGDTALPCPNLLSVYSTSTSRVYKVEGFFTAGALNTFHGAK